MRTEKIKKRKYISISFIANSLIFIGTVFFMIYALINQWSLIIETLQSIVNTQDTQPSIFLGVMIIAMFIPSFFYLIKLNFSLIAFETNQLSHTKYLKSLGGISLKAENILRLAVFVFLLLYVSNYYKFIVNIGEILNILPIRHYYNLGDAGNYYQTDQSFPYLKDIILFNYVFFILLLVWDVTLYFGNRLNKNTLPFIDFFKKYILQHLFGFAIWLFGSFLLLTSFGISILRHWYM